MLAPPDIELREGLDSFLEQDLKKDTLRFTNGIMSRRVIDYLKEKDYQTSLAKLRRESGGPQQHRYSLWEHHPNTRLLWDEPMLMERVNYTHQNPVRAGLTERAQDYRWSSARCWRGLMLPDEPFAIDNAQIAGAIASCKVKAYGGWQPHCRRPPRCG